MSDQDEEIELPFVVTLGVGRVDPDGVLLKITSAASAEKFESRQLDTIVYGMSRTIATELLKGLHEILDSKAPLSRAPRH
jgi:hypothetical protein